MSGRTVYWMNVSMDLRIEHAPNEQGGGSWMRISEDLHREFNARACGAAVAEDARLLELDFGAWEGQAWDSLDRTALDRWGRDPWSFAPPDGESGAAIVARVRAFHESALHDRRDCAVVSHGGPLKILAALLERRPVHLLAAAPALGSVQVVTVCG